MKESEQKTSDQYLDFILQRENYSSFSFFKDNEQVIYNKKGTIDSVSTGMVYIDAKAKKAVIFYNGTKNYSQVLSDASFAPVKMNFGNKEYAVHSGFRHEFEESKESLEYILKDLNKRGIKEITFAGHSKGGAIAPLAALHTKSNNLFKGKISCVTLAAPRVFIGESADSYNKLLGDDTVRVHHNQDNITTLPPAVLGFWHVGNNEIDLSDKEYIDHNKTYYEREYLLNSNVTEIDNESNIATRLIGNFMTSLHQPADTLYRGAKTIIYDSHNNQLRDNFKLSLHNLINKRDEENSLDVLESLFEDHKLARYDTLNIIISKSINHKENGLYPIDLAVQTGQMKLAKKIHEIILRNDPSLSKKHENNNKFDRWLLSEIIKPGNPISEDHLLQYATELIQESENNKESIETFKLLYESLSEKPEIKNSLLEAAYNEVKTYYDSGESQDREKSIEDFASLYESLPKKPETVKKPPETVKKPENNLNEVIDKALKELKSKVLEELNENKDSMRGNHNTRKIPPRVIAPNFSGLPPVTSKRDYHMP